LDLRPERSPLDAAFDVLYRQIAKVDVEAAIQPSGFLNLKANSDHTRLGLIHSEMRILEIGPGSGTLTRKLAESGAEIVCVDLTDAYYCQDSFPREKASCIVADAQALPFIGQFDLVVMTDVLEHVLRPADVLFSVAEALVPGGRLYVRSPANEALAPYGQRRGCSFPAVHLRTYSKATLRAELVAAGFRVGRNIHYERSLTWRFPNAFSVAIRDWLQGQYAQNEQKLPAYAKRLYSLSRRRVWRHLLTSSIEIWASAQLVSQVRPESFSSADVNYVGLIDLESRN